MPSALFKFPYQPKATLHYGEIPDPRITVYLKSLFGFEPVTMLADTGADVSMLPRSWAKRLGIKLSTLKSHNILVASGKEIKVYRGEITLKFRQKSPEITIPCTFTASDQTPLLLGRVGIFHRFSLKFSHTSKALLIFDK
ncbi:MAG: retropepsin-like aspartic protease [bacterium]